MYLVHPSTTNKYLKLLYKLHTLQVKLLKNICSSISFTSLSAFDITNNIYYARK